MNLIRQDNLCCLVLKLSYSETIFYFNINFVCLSSSLFHKVRDPESYRVEGKNGFFKLLRNSYNRAKKLVMYGYDDYHAYQWEDKGILVYCMVIEEDGHPTGQFLILIGRTRCSKPRVDGFYIVQILMRKNQITFIL